MDYNNIPTDRRNLERLIVTYPQKAMITKEAFEKISDNAIDKGIFTKSPIAVKDGKTYNCIDSSEIRINYDNFNPILKKIALGCFALSIFFYLIGGGIFSFSFWAIPSAILTLLAFTIPKDKQLIFHRHKGILEMPGTYYDKPHHVPFKDAPLFFAPYGAAGLFYWALKTKRSFKFSFKDFFPIDLNYFMAPGWETLSYWVWYMDRNRPLPPGDVFDQYRTADFERRKAQGFPPPLYKSRIPTPEATPEQQAERERYWRDEEYMVM